MNTSQTEICKEVLTVERISEEQIRSDNREYNPCEWDKIIDRYIEFIDVVFYKAKPQGGYAYTRYFAVYTTPEGIKLINPVSYSSSLSSRGFCQIIISCDCIIYRKLLRDVKGDYGYCENNKANRLIMAGNSKKFDAIFSNDF